MKDNIDKINEVQRKILDLISELVPLNGVVTKQDDSDILFISGRLLMYTSKRIIELVSERLEEKRKRYEN